MPSEKSVSKSGTGQFVRQGQTTDGLYGSDINPKVIDSTDNPVKDLKP